MHIRVRGQVDISYCSIDIVGDPIEFSQARDSPAPSAHQTEETVFAITEKHP
ncbi:hypothetical protein [Mesorhizobium captivum]|uniref:hypothetical protein n=1 Tax=Mesorhizobium captivum TaxID=3072319 RepID=UPI002A245185|nr:hypothetical protein [Mesorhizobium sp. VK22E]MDX8509797.1 hypothetical protein [Mesorhizobium sp. VK22E]